MYNIHVLSPILDERMCRILFMRCLSWFAYSIGAFLCTTCSLKCTLYSVHYKLSADNHKQSHWNARECSLFTVALQHEIHRRPFLGEFSVMEYGFVYQLVIRQILVNSDEISVYWNLYTFDMVHIYDVCDSHRISFLMINSSKQFSALFN